MRVAIAAFMHESNTFATQKTGLQQFHDAQWDYAGDLIPTWKDAHHEIGGMLQGCGEAGLTLVPVMAASATPSGMVTAEAYEHIVQSLLKHLGQARPFDGLLLALHGSMVAEHYPNADGETLRRVREHLGPEIPIVTTLDMHANISSAMVTHATALVVYRTYPHVDQRARGIETAMLMGRILRGEARPCMAHRKLPLLIHIVQQYTGSGPLADVFREVERIANAPGMLAASVAPGYIYADVADMGVSVLTVANGNAALAESQADVLADFVFNMRGDLNAALPDVAKAVRQTKATTGTVCLMDSGDNIGAGSPGDATFILAELLRQGVPQICTVVYDPEAAKTCFKAGEGSQVALSVGGRTDRQHGDPVFIQGRVIRLHDGVFEESEARHGGTRRFDQGPTAVIGTDDGHTIIVNSLRVMPTSLQQILSLGIDPKQQRAIIVKGVTAPRAAYDPIADHVIAVDSPGVSQAGPESFVYKNRPKPLFPLEEIRDWRPSAT